jgi:hypothetical protein
LRALCRRLALGLAVSLFAAISGSLVANASTYQPPTMGQFASCAQAAQSGSIHRLRLAEAVKCAPGVPMFNASQLVSQTTLPVTFIVVRADGTAVFDVVPSNTKASKPLIASSCYNSWANPTPSGFDGADSVSLNAWGYGNHCNYANVPSTPSVGEHCYVPGCFLSGQQAGHYDSTYGRNNFNMNSAAGWANIQFSGSIGVDTWACRGYVNTNGSQSPNAFCS